MPKPMPSFRPEFKCSHRKLVDLVFLVPKHFGTRLGARLRLAGRECSLEFGPVGIPTPLRPTDFGRVPKILVKFPLTPLN